MTIIHRRAVREGLRALDPDLVIQEDAIGVLDRDVEAILKRAAEAARSQGARKVTAGLVRRCLTDGQK